MEFFKELIANNSTKSSARFMNILGGIVLSLIFIIDFALHSMINIDAFYALAAYFGGVYGVSKALDNRVPVAES